MANTLNFPNAENQARIATALEQIVTDLNSINTTVTETLSARMTSLENRIEELEEQ